MKTAAVGCCSLHTATRKINLDVTTFTTDTCRPKPLSVRFFDSCSIKSHYILPETFRRLPILPTRARARLAWCHDLEWYTYAVQQNDRAIDEWNEQPNACTKWQPVTYILNTAYLGCFELESRLNNYCFFKYNHPWSTARPYTTLTRGSTWIQWHHRELRQWLCDPIKGKFWSLSKNHLRKYQNSVKESLFCEKLVSQCHFCFLRRRVWTKRLANWNVPWDGE